MVKIKIIEIANHREDYKVCKDCGKFNKNERKKCYGCLCREFDNDIRIALMEFYNSFMEHIKEEIDEVEVEV